MPLVVVRGGQLLSLDELVGALSLLAFPYRNDRTPAVGDTVALYTEANFAGYDGAKPLANWTNSIFVNQRAESRADSVSWLHDGGPIDNNLFGICVVDGADNLIFALRDPRAPVLIRPANPTYSYSPVLTLTTEFTGAT